jgi:hypothetical protein
MTNWMMPESRNCCGLPKIYCALARQSARVMYAGGFADYGFILSRTQPTSAGLCGLPYTRDNRPSE